MDLVPRTSTELDVMRPQKHGRNDQRVEIYRQGQIIESFLSDVRVGEPFFIIDGRVQAWFMCVTPIRVDRSLDDVNPTFILGSIEVMQAAPIVERKPEVPAIEHAKPRLSISYNKDDVQDVDL